LRRREFIQAAGAAALGAAASTMPGLGAAGEAQAQTQVVPPGKLPRLMNVTASPLSTSEPLTSYEHLTTYNNFYEFARYDAGPIDASALRTDPWKISIGGLVAKPGTFDLAEFLKPYSLEERIYRHRCVESWSAVFPWIGVPLADVIKRFEPTSKAGFLEFVTLLDPSRLPGQRENVLTWPYVEALRMDEAMHPLAILAVGLYGEAMPKQDGAPIRLVVPWKYGFKSIKSIVRIRFVESRPATTWMIKDQRAYGFYSNVNPDVDHPGWSQATERRLGEFRTRKTLPFNGYADQVASLYTGMDLRRNR
jgi:methionine sulfoxide reductase catalytic subunit